MATQTRAYYCDFRRAFDPVEGELVYVPSIVAEAGTLMPAGWSSVDSATDATVPAGRVKVIVPGCPDFVDDAIMGVDGVRRATA